MAYNAIVRCHEWRGKTVMSNSGFFCMECKQEVDNAKDMMSGTCDPRGIDGGSSWFPLGKFGFPILREGEAIFGGEASNK